MSVIVSFTCTGLNPPSSLLLDHPGFPAFSSHLPNSCLPTVPERLKELDLSTQKQKRVQYAILRIINKQQNKNFPPKIQKEHTKVNLRI